MRTCGILMPVFSLASKGGIGAFGKEAYRFVDFLEKAGQSWWQILPLNPTNFGDSPYQSFSSYAGNPYFIDPEFLVEEGLLTNEELDSFDFGDNPNEIDYEKLYNNRYKMLELAFSRFIVDTDYSKFCSENAYWLNEYALFMALKSQNANASWNCWPQALKEKKAADIKKATAQNEQAINFHKFIQYKFSCQWFKLKEYANGKGIGIIGDIPIYVALDSSDVWSEPDQFQLDNDMNPSAVAGCPPDAFAEEGQLWGNPLYDWKKMKSENFAWWKRRLGYALKLYDMVRIDHFRGFESYWSVPFEAKTAKGGKWIKGPDYALFKELKNEFGEDVPIIAEDLGFLTPKIHLMLKKCGFPGMKVLQFAFSNGEDSEYLPHNYSKNCVVYTGTHDNDTVLGWAENISEADLEMAKKYLNAKDNEGLNWNMIRAAQMSVADTCILTMQDLIGLKSEGRINTPSTLGENWKWRISDGCINDWLAKILYDKTKESFRLKEKEERV